MCKSFLRSSFFTFFIATQIVGSQRSAKAQLVEIQKINPAIATDIIYATNKNFTGQIIYKSSQCYFLPQVAQALSKVQQELEQKGLGLVVWDGYRPMSAQKKLWDVCAQQYPDEKERENYVSNPAKGGRHTRGTAADCTLIDLKTGQLLEMPTEFDHFGPEAWRDYNGPKLSLNAKKNREVLQTVMEKYGFKGLKSEWWHFDYHNWEQCPPLDIEL